MKVKKVYGSAGSGKTSFLLNIVDNALRNGMEPENIGYISFTNVAIKEAIDRAAKKFKLPKKRFKFFRTLHSLAFYCTGASAESILNMNGLKDFGKQYGYSLGGILKDGLYIPRVTRDAKMLTMYSAGRENGLTVQEGYEQGTLDVGEREYYTLIHRYKKFKKDKQYMDFQDMIERAFDMPLPKFKLLLVDEAQDFSPIQWKLIDRLVEKADDVYLAGDDLQSLYEWRGATSNRFIEYPAEDIKLTKSHRVPKYIQMLADHWALRNIKNKLERICEPREADGEIITIKDIYCTDFKPRGKTYMVLACDTYYLNKLMKDLTDMGVPAEMNGRKNYSRKMYVTYKKYGAKKAAKHMKDIEDYKFFARCKARDLLHLLGDNVVKVSTVHNAKGAEADVVVFDTRLTKKSYDEIYTNPDNFYRKLYVALTRARETLYILYDDSAENSYKWRKLK